ncbi:MAG: hypothetical protein MUO40_00375 [Anaerolineaceae bacterium]|nr:hypothetical protein [Anaerolineaceae bacterium]
MKKQRKKNNFNTKWSKLKSEAGGTMRSGLGFVPGLGMALNIHDTAKRTNRTTRAARECLDELSSELERRYKKHKKRRPRG